MFRSALFSLLIFCSSLNLPAQAIAKPLSADSLVEEARRSKLYEHNTWRRLLRYNKAILGYYASNEINSQFFVAPNGRNDPQAELEAELRAFDDPTPRDLGKRYPAQSVKCEFPARYFFLMTELGQNPSEANFSDCENYREFRDRMQAHSVTLVFSSYYMNNPGSVFGHSLLRFNRSDLSADHSSEPAALLDYGVNYGAIQTTKNPLLYAIMGLGGLFYGEFASLHYYYKVREYNDFEARDLWEYDLNITQDEVAQLVRHIWELGFSDFPYYYLSENCSYHILLALEAAAPRLELTSKLPHWVIPADTIRVVAIPGIGTDATHGPLLVKVRYRPSLYSQFKTRFAKIKKAEGLAGQNKIAAFNRVVQNFDPKLSSDPEVLDTALDYLDIKYGKEINNKDPKALALKQKFLVERSHLATADELIVPVPDREAPHAGHASMRWGYSRGEELNRNANNGQTQNQNEFDIRFALHDKVDPITGYPRFSTVEFMRIRAKFFEASNELRLTSWQFVNIENLTPYDPYFPHMSLKFSVGGDRIQDGRCDDCFAGTTEGGVGYSVGLTDGLRTFATFDATTVIYVLAMARADVGPFRGASLSANVGPLLGVRQIWSSNFLSFVEMRRDEYFHSADGGQNGSEWFSNRVLAESQYTFRDSIGLFAHGEWESANRSWLVGVRYFH